MEWSYIEWSFSNGCSKRIKVTISRALEDPKERIEEYIPPTLISLSHLENIFDFFFFQLCFSLQRKDVQNRENKPNIIFYLAIFAGIYI
jgi:hypothetical protein